MFTECRGAIKGCLEEVVGKNAYVSLKKLRLAGESKVIAVLFEEDELEKDGSKRIYTADTGRHKRRKKYGRQMTFNVVIGDYSIGDVEETFDKFLRCLPSGLYVDGNYVSIEARSADWLDEEDSILRAKCAVQIKVVCDGGIYVDTDYKAISDVNITAEKE